MADSIRLDSITFKYASMAEPLFSDVSIHLATGWTGVVGPNGAGKSSLLKLICGSLSPDGGHLWRPEGRVIYCQQRTDDPPEALSDLLGANDGGAWMWRARLEVEDDWLERWPSLSHGERKRAQVATALWQEPSVFAVDEPTNHLDHAARETLYQALRAYKGVGILVSHDRRLLDELCAQCLFCDPPAVVARSGGVTAGLAQAGADAAKAVQDRDRAQTQLQRLEREAVKRRELAAKQHQMRSKRGLGKGDNDERYKRNRARYTGKDGTGGKLLKQMEGRVGQAKNVLAQSHVAKTYATGIWAPGSRSPKEIVCALPAETISLGPQRHLDVPDLVLRRDDRIALVGSNGSGKTTLIRRLMSEMRIDRERIVYLPQEVDVSQSRGVLESAKSLPKGQLGHVMAIISRLNSRPERLLQSETPSPGEIRKLMLALGISRSPYLIVMDEPTNHLDLPSIACLEGALSECPCCLLFVSHDASLVEALGRRHWTIESEDSGEYVLMERSTE